LKQSRYRLKEFKLKLVIELLLIILFSCILAVATLRGLISDDRVLAGGGTAIPPRMDDYMKYYIPYFQAPSSLGVEWLSQILAVPVQILCYILSHLNNLNYIKQHVLLVLVAAFLASYLSSRFILGAGIQLALFLSLMYTLNPALSVLISHLDLNTALAYSLMPVLFIVTSRIIQTEIKPKTIFVISFATMIIVSIYPNASILILVLSLALVVASSLFAVRYRDRRFLLRGLLTAIFLALSVVVYHIPVLIGQTGYVQQGLLASYNEILKSVVKQYGSWSLPLFLRFVSDSATFAGSPLINTSTLGALYLALLALFVGLGLLNKDSWEDSLFVLSVFVFVFVLTFCFLTRTGLMYWVFLSLPAMGYVRQPRTWFLIFIFPYIYIISKGLERITLVFRLRQRSEVAKLIKASTVYMLIAIHLIYQTPLLLDGFYGMSYIRGDTVFVPRSILKIVEVLPELLEKGSTWRIFIVPNGATPIAAATRHVLNTVDYASGDTELDRYIRNAYLTLLSNPDAAALLAIPLGGKYLAVIRDAPYDTSKPRIDKYYFVIDPKSVEDKLRNSRYWRLIYNDTLLAIYENILMERFSEALPAASGFMIHFGDADAEARLAQYLAMIPNLRADIYITIPCTNEFLNMCNNISIRGAELIYTEYGEALKFDGKDDYIEIPSSEFWIPNEFSIILWIFNYTPAGNRHSILIAKGDGPNPVQGFSLRYGWDYDLRFMIGNGSASIGTNAIWVDTFPAFIAAVYNGTTLRLYVNGVLKHSVDLNTSVAYGAHKLFVGGLPGTGGYYFNGVLSSIVIFSRALSDEEIAALYFAGPLALEAFSNGGDSKNTAGTFEALYITPHITISGLSKEDVMSLLNMSLEYCRNGRILVLLNEPVPYYWSREVKVSQDLFGTRAAISARGPLGPGFIVAKVNVCSSRADVTLIKSGETLWRAELQRGTWILPFYTDGLNSSDRVSIEFSGCAEVRGAAYISVNEMQYFILILSELKKYGCLASTWILGDAMTRIVRLGTPGGQHYTDLFKEMLSRDTLSFEEQLIKFSSELEVINVSVVNKWPYEIRLNVGKGCTAAALLSWRMFHQPVVRAPNSVIAFALPGFGGLTTVVVVNEHIQRVNVEVGLFDGARQLILRLTPLYYLAFLAILAKIMKR